MQTLLIKIFLKQSVSKHYQGSPLLEDTQLQNMAIDRIYDTLIDEDHLRICDDTIFEIANSLEPRPYSSREFIQEMGRYLEKHAKNKNSIVLKSYQKISLSLFLHLVIAALVLGWSCTKLSIQRNMSVSILLKIFVN